MSEKTLRLATIKLAHENPELRRHLLPLLKQSGEFTKDQWKEHKRKYPGADAKDHTITNGDSGESKKETEAGPSVSQDMKDKVMKEWGIQYLHTLKHHISDLKTLKDVEDKIEKFTPAYREEDKQMVGALKDIKDALEKAEGEKSEKSEKKAHRLE